MASRIAPLVDQPSAVVVDGRARGRPLPAPSRADEVAERDGDVVRPDLDREVFQRVRLAAGLKGEAARRERAFIAPTAAQRSRPPCASIVSFKSSAGVIAAPSAPTRAGETGRIMGRRDFFPLYMRGPAIVP